MMPRMPRFNLPGVPQHVIQRGNNKSSVFLSGDDYSFFMKYLKDACDKYDCLVHAYVLMTNHVHLILNPNNRNSISRTMQSAGLRYTQYFNKKYYRTGTLWEGRYKAAIIDSDRYLLTCYRYVELNPVRAGMVVNPAEYAWSSFNYHAHGVEDSLITDHEIYMQLGNSAHERQIAYQGLVKQKIHVEQIRKIRESTNQCWALGDGKFRNTVEKQAERRATPLPRGGDRRSVKYKINSV